MSISITGGLKDIADAAGDIASAPIKLAQGDGGALVDAVKSPMKAKRGLLKTLLGAVAAPFHAIGIGGQPPAVQDGAQRAIERYL